MWTEKRSPAILPIGEPTAITIRTSPENIDTWRHPGTARGVPRSVWTRRA